MKASDLLGQPVIGSDGSQLGVVIDLRCVQDGPPRGVLATLRIDSLIVSGRHTGSLLGYDRRSQQGPWLVRHVVRALHPHIRVIPWAEVEDHSDGQITLRPGATPEPR